MRSPRRRNDRHPAAEAGISARSRNVSRRAATPSDVAGFRALEEKRRQIQTATEQLQSQRKRARQAGRPGQGEEGRSAGGRVEAPGRRVRGEAEANGSGQRRRAGEAARVRLASYPTFRTRASRSQRPEDAVESSAAGASAQARLPAEGPTSTSAPVSTASTSNPPRSSPARASS